ncbi:transmembrane cytochrome oxidase associated protein [Pseudoalteromonas piscicida]|uniref:Transmembrane cytochrome oxidase associated protein n=1 Tax=Pseudoalteromonas piscicida TaxID=43662 RepID=A0A2A5JKJ1_PSEO7|nr:transmembrane cytochrome oxidase associated protein [Pseudoalteromonas piscicida]PCK29943.1 transmembrane cytochrome oxidase associated protein [Pseudoalteromonas piscicida]
MSKTAVWFIGLFVLPLLLAFVALKLDWLPNSTTNHGEFLRQEVRQPEVVLDTEWSIVYQRPQSCDEQCSLLLNSLPNLYLALGKYQQKVSVVVLQNQDEPVVEHATSLPLHLTQLQDNYIYLVDKTGLFVLQYAPTLDQAKMRSVQKGLLSDLKKLLNYSRSS